MQSLDLGPNKEEKLEKLDQDYDTPFSPPIDIKEDIPWDYPLLDTGVDYQQWYDEGRTGAAEANIIKNKIVKSYRKPIVMPVKMKLNVNWHAINKMPKKPTLIQRVEWHREHIKYCECRKPPAKIQPLLNASL